LINSYFQIRGKPNIAVPFSVLPISYQRDWIYLRKKEFRLSLTNFM
jgi:hypothetical protein